MKGQIRTLPLIVILSLVFVYGLSYAFGMAVSRYASGITLSLITAWLLMRGGKISRSYRESWFFAAGAALSWGVLETLSALLSVLVPGTTPPLALGFLYLAPAAMILASLIFMAFKERQRWSTLQFFMDNAAFMLCVSGLLYFAFVRVSFFPLKSGGAWSAESALIAVSAFLDMTAATFLFSIVITLKWKNVPLFLALFLVGGLLYIATDFGSLCRYWNGSCVSVSLARALSALSFALYGVGAWLFVTEPIELTTTRARVLTLNGIVNRTIMLLIVPTVSLLTRRPAIEELAFYVIVILAHQIVSLLLRGHVLASVATEENRRLTQRLDLMIADRTRELEVMNQTLENLVMRDEITGQFNRKYFIETLEKTIAETGEGERIWFILIDFDRFKSINDTYGHDVGDMLLRAIGRRLEVISNAYTSLARLGGDEFGIAATRSGQIPVRELVVRVRELLDSPVLVGHYTIRVSYSIGVACWPVDALTRSDLMRHADIALYEAKKNRSRRVAYFERDTNAAVERSHQIDIALGKINLDRDFSLVFQPQFSIEGRRLIGVEALVRWNSADLGIVGPDEFIPVAEENGVILPLSDWIARQAIGTLARWNGERGHTLTMGINISPVQFNDIYFFAKLSNLISEYAIDPSLVNVEITERTAMGDEQYITDMFDRLSDLGVKSSIDDFGTGYSSLSYLKRYRIHYLKIAKQLVDSIADDADTGIVQAIVMMAKALGLRTIAEGVEDETQFAILESLGCDEIQGYYLGKPLPADEFEKTYFSV